MDRRDFIKVAGIQAGALLAASGCTNTGRVAASGAPGLRGSSPEIVVIGGGTFGGWTAYHLQRLGHQVTLVDLYGPGNSRSTSGDETRGIRTGYMTNELWTRWAKEAIELWKGWDEEWGTRMFTTTGDLALRPSWDDFLTTTMATWDRTGVRYERVTDQEVRYRFPQIDPDGLSVGVYEPDAGVARSRFATLTVADQFQKLGGRVVVAHAEAGASAGDRLVDLVLTPGERLSAQTFVFALGPWFPKAMPRVMGEMIRTPMGHVFYFGTPPGDTRFSTPHCPSYNFPGVTGWPNISHDSRGFRVRATGGPPGDPDVSVRWVAPEFHEPARKVLIDRFPALSDAPVLETRACHYESSATRNFIIDRHPEFSNVWIAGGGSAEGFKFGPVLGPYIADRVTGRNQDATLAETFRYPVEILAGR
jgi:sarcosine oxidase